VSDTDPATLNPQLSPKIAAALQQHILIVNRAKAVEQRIPDQITNLTLASRK
jgi:hypothetical protein